MRIEDLKNLGPVTAGWLAEINIYTLEDLQNADLIDVYAQLKLNGHPVSKNLVTGLYGAINDVDWRLIDKETKMNLYNKIDQLIDEREKDLESGV